MLRGEPVWLLVLPLQTPIRPVGGLKLFVRAGLSASARTIPEAPIQSGRSPSPAPENPFGTEFAPSLDVEDGFRISRSQRTRGTPWDPPNASATPSRSTSTTTAAPVVSKSSVPRKTVCRPEWSARSGCPTFGAPGPPQGHPRRRSRQQRFRAVGVPAVATRRSRAADVRSGRTPPRWRRPASRAAVDHA
jgi:hypothetical protein